MAQAPAIVFRVDHQFGHLQLLVHAAAAVHITSQHKVDPNAGVSKALFRSLNTMSRRHHPLRVNHRRRAEEHSLAALGHHQGTGGEMPQGLLPPHNRRGLLARGRRKRHQDSDHPTPIWSGSA